MRNPPPCLYDTQKEHKLAARILPAMHGTGIFVRCAFLEARKRMHLVVHESPFFQFDSLGNEAWKSRNASETLGERRVFFVCEYRGLPGTALVVD